MRTEWTEERDNLLRRHYPTKGADYCMELIGCTRVAIICRVRKLKITRLNYRMNKQQQQYIRDNYPAISVKQMADDLLLPWKRIQAFVHRYKLNSTKCRPFSASDLQYIREHYRHHSYKEIGEALGRSADSIRHQCNSRLKLKRTPEEARAIQQRCCSSTYFPKGNEPHNTRKDGDLSLRQEHHGGPYVFIRTSKGVWEKLQHINWQQKYGPIPDDKILVCKSDDPQNCHPDNWMLMDRGNHLDRNNGRDELTDKYVLRMLSPKDKELRRQLARHPELIELKRTDLQLKQTINECSSKITTDC